MRVRAYVNGVEIDKIPELAEVCAMNNWMDGLIAWTVKTHPDLKIDAIFVGEATDFVLAEIWIGGAPPLRALELGGVLKSFFKKAGS